MPIVKVLAHQTAVVETAKSPVASKAERSVPEDERLRMKAASQEFESVFVSQMLKHAGFDKAFGSEAQEFSQFMLDEIGGEMAVGMELGFAEKAYEHMISRYNAGDADDG